MKRAKLNNQYSRRKMAVGGNIDMGSEITADNISNSDVNAGANVGLSTASGAAAGAIAGSFVPVIGTAIGAVIGGAAGFIGGLLGNRKRKKEMAANQEAARQQVIGNMTGKQEADTMSLRSEYDDNQVQSYYAKYGGAYPMRRRMAVGGMVPNSSDTEVAYGATHNQYNENTGTTGVMLNNNVEVEGGGYQNGNAQAGEVVSYESNNAYVYSDKLKPKGSKKTYAEIAKEISDEKGNLETKSISLLEDINKGLENVYNTKTNKLKAGTNVRNVEKLAVAMNKVDGKIAMLDGQLDQLYNNQEVKATNMGLRGSNEDIVRYGGRRKMMSGGAMFGMNMGMNVLNTLSTAEAINYESKLETPMRSTTETPIYDYKYNITPELQALDNSQRNIETYIKSNTSNPQVARSIIASISANAAAQRGQSYARQNMAEQEGHNRNIQASYQNTMRNQDIGYENSVSAYNKAVDINSKRAANKQQFLQGTAQAAQSYLDWETQMYATDMYALTSPNESIPAKQNELRNRYFGSNSWLPSWLRSAGGNRGMANNPVSNMGNYGIGKVDYKNLPNRIKIGI